MKSILISNYGLDIETVAYTNDDLSKKSFIMLMQVSNNAGTTAGVSMWITDENNNKLAQYIPNNTQLGGYAIIGDDAKHVVPPKHKVKFKCSQEGCFFELTIKEGLK